MLHRSEVGARSGRLRSGPFRVDTGRVAACGRASRNITSDDASRADHGIISYGYARQNDRSAANPHILTDPDGAPELDTRSADSWITWMVCRIYLDRGADLRSRSNSHSHDVKDNAIEIEKYVWPDPDIVAVVAMKWWSDHHAVSGLCQQLLQEGTPVRVRGAERRVVSNHPRGGGASIFF